MYRPLPKSLTIKDSKIDGLGLFSKTKIQKNSFIGITHVKPNALDEFVRITKSGGIICFTINEGIYEEYGFDK